MLDNILTNIIFLPLFMAVVLGVFRANIHYLKIGAMFSSVATLFLVMIVTYNFDPETGMQFGKNLAWIKNAGVSYFIGVDALSLVITQCTVDNSSHPKGDSKSSTSSATLSNLFTLQ